MLESINEIKKSLDLLRSLYGHLRQLKKNNAGFLLLLRSAIDGIEDELFLIDSVIHGSIEDKEATEH